MASEREASAWPRPRASVPRRLDERTSTFIPSSVWGHRILSGFAYLRSGRPPCGGSRAGPNAQPLQRGLHAPAMMPRELRAWGGEAVGQQQPVRGRAPHGQAASSAVRCTAGRRRRRRRSAAKGKRGKARGGVSGWRRWWALGNSVDRREALWDWQAAAAAERAAALPACCTARAAGGEAVRTPAAPAAHARALSRSRGPLARSPAPAGALRAQRVGESRAGTAVPRALRSARQPRGCPLVRAPAFWRARRQQEKGPANRRRRAVGSAAGMLPARCAARAAGGARGSRAAPAARRAVGRRAPDARAAAPRRIGRNGTAVGRSRRCAAGRRAEGGASARPGGWCSTSRTSYDQGQSLERPRPGAPALLSPGSGAFGSAGCDQRCWRRCRARGARKFHVLPRHQEHSFATARQNSSLLRQTCAARCAALRAVCVCARKSRK